MPMISPRWSSLSRLRSFTFLLLVLLLPIQLGKHFWPDFSSVSGMRIDYLSPTLYATDILIVIFLSLSFSKIVSVLKKNLFLAFFFSAVFISAVLAQEKLLALYGTARIVEFVFFGIASAEFFSLAKLSPFRTLFFALAVLYESLIAIVQFFLQHSIGSVFYFLGERTFTASTPGIATTALSGALFLRPYATFSHPNVLAGFLVLLLPFLFFALSGARPRWALGLLVSAIVFGTIALFLTLSRVALLLWFILIFGLLLRKSINTKIQKMVLGVLLLLSLGLFLFTPLGQRFFESSTSEVAVTDRLQLLQAAIAMLSISPIFGVGPLHFLVHVSEFSVPTKNLFATLQPVHNVYALLLSELGLVGFLFVLQFIKKTWEKISHLSMRSPLLISCVFLIVLSFVDHYLFTSQQGRILLALLLGASWASPKKKNS